MGDQAGGAGEQRNAADDGRREVEIEQHGGDRHRDVEGQRPAPDALRGLLETPRQIEVRAGGAAFLGEGDDPFRPRVDRLVEGVAEAGQAAALGLDPTRDRLGRGLRIAARQRRRPRLRQDRAAELRRSEHHAAGAEQTRGDGALQGLRRGRVGHPRRLHRRDQPVLGDGDEEQVEEEPLLARSARVRRRGGRSSR